MSDRATSWSVTINNPTAADDEYIALAKQKSGWTVEGQLEKGENGTPHYQLLVRTPQVRFSAIKKQFPRAHIEVARNVKALQAYVHKEDTKVGELTVNDKYPSLSKLWDLFATWLEEDNLTKYFHNQDPDSKLQTFDQFIKQLILDGYHVETLAVNPQTRSCVKNYGSEIIVREIRRQTADRQTNNGLKNVAPNIQNATQEDETQSQATSESSYWTECTSDE